MKKILILFLLVFFPPLNSKGGENNRLAAFWQMPAMDQITAEKLTRFDLVVVDMENWFNNPGHIQIIRQLNPDCKILTYYNPMELFDPPVPGRPLQSAIYQNISTKYPKWWLNQPDGQPIYYWDSPRMRMLNLSSQCPTYQGMDCVGFLTQILQDSLFSKQGIGGLFVDNAFDNVSWILNGNIDINNDGQTDHPDSLDLWWQQGVEKFLRLTNTTIGNEANLYYQDILAGKFFENAPCNYLGGWYGTIQNYLTMSLPLNIIHAEPKDEKWRLFLLATALLGDGSFCYGINQTEWFPEYDLISELGNPLEQTQSPHELVWQHNEELVLNEFCSDTLLAGEYIVSYKYVMENRVESRLVCEARSVKYGGVFAYSQQTHQRWPQGNIHQKINLSAVGKIVWRITGTAVANIWDIKIWRKNDRPWVRQYQGGKALVWPKQERGEIILHK